MSKETQIAKVGPVPVTALASVDEQTLSVGLPMAGLAFGTGDQPIAMAIDGGAIPTPVLESDPQQIDLPDGTANVIYVQGARLAEGSKFEDQGERDGFDIVITGMALAEAIKPEPVDDGTMLARFNPAARLVYCRAFLPFPAAVGALGSIEGIGTTRARQILASNDLSQLSIFPPEWPDDEIGRIDGLSSRLSQFMGGLLLQLGNNGLRKSKRDAARQVRDYTFNAQRAEDARLCIPDNNGEIKWAPITAVLEHRLMAGGALSVYATQNGQLMQWWDRVEPVKGQSK